MNDAYTHTQYSVYFDRAIRSPLSLVPGGGTAYAIRGIAVYTRRVCTALPISAHHATESRHQRERERERETPRTCPHDRRSEILDIRRTRATWRATPHPGRQRAPVSAQPKHIHRDSKPFHALQAPSCTSQEICLSSTSLWVATPPPSAPSDYEPGAPCRSGAAGACAAMATQKRPKRLAYHGWRSEVCTFWSPIGMTPKR